MTDEYISTPPENPYAFDLVRHKDIWALYEGHRSTFWTLEKLNFQEDINDWDALREDQQNLLKRILAFFAAADLIVVDNIRRLFIDEVQLHESKVFYNFQTAMEDIHNETYRAMLDCFIMDDTEKNQLIHSVNTDPAVKAKADWILRWMSTDRPLAERIIAFICFEGISFCSSFAVIFWFKEEGILHQLCTSNEYISRDEGLHVMHGIYLYKKMTHKARPEVVQQIFHEAVDLEIAFSEDTIKGVMLGLNPRMMSDYIRNLANMYLRELEVPEIYGNVQQPFRFMDKILAKNISSFFEVEPIDYSLSRGGTQH